MLQLNMGQERIYRAFEGNGCLRLLGNKEHLNAYSLTILKRWSYPSTQSAVFPGSCGKG